ncbi:MAG: hypothetical protein Q9169_002081 [Polycauliona sp. 2 TL-2023]
MPKRSIADFFKPFAFVRQSQPSSADHEAENPRPSRRSRSSTPLPNAQSGPDPAATSSPIVTLPEPSSQSSVLSSLRGSTPVVPEELPTRSIELPIVPAGNTISLDSSFGADFGGSQAAIIPSSQRVVRNGQVVIKDSDDERSESDISLEDLDDLIAPRKISPISTPFSDNFQPLAKRSSTNMKNANKERDGSRHATTINQSVAETKLPTYKFSLDALLEQNQSYEDSRESIEDVKQLLECLEEQKGRATADSKIGLDKDLLATVMRRTDDETDMGRLMAAIERTEALHQEETWSFFDGNDPTVEVEQSLDYQTTDSLTIDRMNRIFTKIDARPDALNLENPAIPSVNRMSPQLSRHTMGILSRLLLDREVILNHNLLHIIHDIMSKVIDHTVDNGDDETIAMLATLYHSVQNPGLQLQLLRNLPSSNSHQTLFRRRIALAFFFQDPVYLSKPRQQLLDMKTTTRCLRQPRFAVNNGTDYPNLAASVSILAIGLDNGDPPPAEASKEAIVAFNEDLDMLAQRIKGMFTQIVDTGASHMRRTEAKEVLESFHSCLVYAVRTKQKSKGRMWEDEVGVEKQKSVMKTFVQRDKAVDKPVNGLH